MSCFSARFCWLHSEGDAVDPLLNVTELNKKKNFLSFLILYKRLLTQGQVRSVRIEVTSHTYKYITFIYPQIYSVALKANISEIEENIYLIEVILS